MGTKLEEYMMAIEEISDAFRKGELIIECAKSENHPDVLKKRIAELESLVEHERREKEKWKDKAKSAGTEVKRLLEILRELAGEENGLLQKDEGGI